MARLETARAPMHRFFDMDYQEYFATQHEAPIGLYFYDGNHDYEHQLRGLEVAEPFFTDDCCRPGGRHQLGRPHQATLDFIAQSDREYEILVDVQHVGGLASDLRGTAVMVFQAVGPASEQRDVGLRARRSTAARGRVAGAAARAEPGRATTAGRRSSSLVVVQHG